jgi:hypothetical protein
MLSASALLHPNLSGTKINEFIEIARNSSYMTPATINELNGNVVFSDSIFLLKIAERSFEFWTEFG